MSGVARRLVPADPTIEVRAGATSFGAVQAPDGVGLTAEERCMLGLNGAGKTALIRILTTLLGPHRG